MIRQIFGAISSPFFCSFDIKKMAADLKHEFPTAAPRVSTNFYVDNYLDSFDTEEEAITECRQLVDLFKRGRFHLTQRSSSSRHLLSKLPESDRITPEIDLDLDQLPTERALGIRWNSRRQNQERNRQSDCKQKRYFRFLMPTRIHSKNTNSRNLAFWDRLGRE